jgi:hypothetical protein
MLDGIQHVFDLGGVSFVQEGRQRLERRADLVFGLYIPGGKPVFAGDRCIDVKRIGNPRFLRLEHDLLGFSVVDNTSGHLTYCMVVPQDGDREVFHFRVVVREVGDDAGHFAGQSHHPVEQVDVVYRVVERASATLLLPGPAPPQIVIT